MKQMIRMFAMTLSLLPLFAAAQLPTDQKLVSKVPFEFVAAGKVVPAGQYTVQKVTDGIPVISIKNRDANVALLSSTGTMESKAAASQCALVFHKYGDRYFLAAIRIEGSKTVMSLPENKAEAELRAQNVTATEEILLAQLN